MIRQTFGYIRNKICAELLNNKNIIKALVVEDKNFLDTTLNDEQQNYIDNPLLLMRNYIYPYKKISTPLRAKVWKCCHSIIYSTNGMRRRPPRKSVRYGSLSLITVNVYLQQ